MNKMNKKIEYALMALKCFCDYENNSKGDQTLFSAKDISDMTKAPYDVMARVLQVLSSRGILRVEYGVSGGYHLSKNLTDVSVLELIEILEGSKELTKCLGSDQDCELIGQCSILSPIKLLNQKIKNFYQSISLAEVLHV